MVTEILRFIKRSNFLYQKLKFQIKSVLPTYIDRQSKELFWSASSMHQTLPLHLFHILVFLIRLIVLRHVSKSVSYC